MNFHLLKRLLAFGLLSAVMTSGAWADVGDYVLKDGKIYRNDKGTEKLLPDDEPQFFNTDAGMWAWILVDPELSDEMKGSESGIYFFLDGKPVTFLPIEEAGSCMMEFSPSGKKVLISSGGEAKRELGFYTVSAEKKAFAKKASFVSAGRFFWIDPHRFVFNSVDEGKGHRMKDWEYRGNEAWWCSATMYDTIEETATVLEEANAVRNFTVTECDTENGTLEIWEHFVTDEQDWEDERKVKDRDFRIDIPAAG